MTHFNEDMFNTAMFNDGGGGVFVPVVVTTPDPGVSFTISDELGGEGEVTDNNGSIC